MRPRSPTAHTAGLPWAARIGPSEAPASLQRLPSKCANRVRFHPQASSGAADQTRLSESLPPYGSGWVSPPRPRRPPENHSSPSLPPPIIHHWTLLIWFVQLVPSK